MVIHLRPGIAAGLLRPLPVPPPHQPQADKDSKGPFSKRNLFDLAQGGVFQARNVAIPAGELLPHLFTLTPTFVRAVSLSVALSLGSPPLRIKERLAL